MASSRSPGIDEWHRKIGKVRRIARCQLSMVGEYHSSDHRVAQFTRPAFLVPKRHQITRLLCGSSIERNNSMPDLLENRFERLY